MSKRWEEAADIIYKLCNERYSGPLSDLEITEGDISRMRSYTPRTGSLSSGPAPPRRKTLSPKSSVLQLSALGTQIPLEYEEEGQLWVQHVSSSPATRMDVINLQEQLDMKLLQRQARETGICAIRRELYDQCFDELIRQVTVNCAERGLLLLRVRDELRMTLAAYQTLYESSIAFGVRKALQAEQRKLDTEQLVENMTAEKEELNNQVTELKQKFETFERKTAEQKQVDERKYNEEIQFLKRTNQQLKVNYLACPVPYFCFSLVHVVQVMIILAQLEGIIAPKK
ncbi:DNALI1 [Cordylochernes scorpioides]|uniref:DNALI1 n=1 Tax=Cordylochernes scorpioides TaxID=51811 RepID=A0ABY6K7D7_9ARAC|nr:DNALI1 [Cordylochernes scorpioides]